MQVKFRIPEILLGAMLAVAIFAMGMTFQSSLPPPNQEAAQTSNPSAEHSSTKITGPNSPDERIANYTWWLSAFTLALVVVSAFQGFFLIRADKTARTAANAADLNARAAIAIELPIIKASLDSLTNGVSQEFGVRRERCSVHSVTFSNVGRTKAFPVELRYGFATWSLPKTPRYTFVETYQFNEIFENDPKITNRKFLASDKEIEMGEWSFIAGGQCPVWFYCELEYLDFMQSPQKAAFCWCWKNIGGGMGWRPDETAAYNR